MPFNLQLALQLAKALDRLAAGDVPATIVNAGTDTQVRVEEVRPGEFTVLFPGTASRRDWRTDANILKTDWGFDGIKVHRGFAEAYRSIGSELLLALQGADRVLIGGHSLGGALGTLAADILQDLGIPVQAVYTFGSPRVGNRAFAECYNEALEFDTYRIVNARDPVPWLPWPLWIPRTGIYTHVNSLVYLPHDGGIELDAGLIERAKHLADAAAIITDQSRQPEFFGDILTARTHSIRSYILKLEALA